MLEMPKFYLLSFGALSTPKRWQHTGASPLEAAKENENDEMVELLEPQSGSLQWWWCSKLFYVKLVWSKMYNFTMLTKLLSFFVSWISSYLYRWGFKSFQMSQIQPKMLMTMRMMKSSLLIKLQVKKSDPWARSFPMALRLRPGVAKSLTWPEQSSSTVWHWKITTS